MGAVFESELAAEDGGDTRALRALGETHRSVKTIAIGQRDRR